MNLYSQYIAEREGKTYIELPGQGFATFLFEGEECYIGDIYVIPESRNTKVASQLADHITGVAKERGCKRLSCQVDLTANEPTRSIKVILAYGFKLWKLKGSRIILAKEL